MFDHYYCKIQPQCYKNNENIWALFFFGPIAITLLIPTLYISVKILVSFKPWSAIVLFVQLLVQVFFFSKFFHSISSALSFLACLDEVQEELLYYPGVGFGGGVGISKMLKFLC